MATAEVLAVEELLEPVTEDAPAGEDLRADSSPNSLYYRVKDARIAARAAERANIEDASAVPPEWRIVVEAGSEALRTKGKDLEIAAWMVEALVRLEGFAGLRDGFRLIEGLVARFWDDLYPQPDEDGIATRVAPVTGLNGEGGDGTLILPIRNVPLTQGAEHSYALWQFEQAAELDRMTDADRKAAKIAAGALSMEQFTATVNETPAEFFVDLAEDIELAQAAFAAMNSALDQAAGADSPPYGKIRDALEAALDAVRFFAAEKLADAAADAEAADAADVDVAAEGYADAGEGSPAQATGRRRNGEYQTREEALADIQRIAAYFRKQEPHSPISYTLEEVVRRSRLSLPELLAELIQDDSARRLFLLASGIKPPEEASSGY